MGQGERRAISTRPTEARLLWAGFGGARAPGSKSPSGNKAREHLAAVLYGEPAHGKGHVCHSNRTRRVPGQA